MRRTGMLALLATLALAAETGTIEGRLLKGDGSPWAGAQVTAYKLGQKQPPLAATPLGQAALGPGHGHMVTGR